MRHLVLLIAIAAAVSCRGDDRNAIPGAGDELVDLTGAGATFPYPVYAKWISRFAGEQGLRINYRSVGSGGGIQALDDGSVDFGASDVPLDSVALSARAANDVVQFPLVVGGVVVTYNLPAVTAPLQFDGATLADIFSGAITRWSDPRIARLNPGVLLPVLPIQVVHRAESSGTTQVFARFLEAASPRWPRSGDGRVTPFTVGVAAAGNEGVAVEVKVSVGSIAYVEQSYATLNRLPSAAIKNGQGRFVHATPASLAAAAGSAEADPAAGGFPVSLLSARDSSAYPLAALTWVVVRRDRATTDKLRTLAAFVRWSLDAGASDATSLGYAPLPDPIRQRVLSVIDTLARTPSTR